MGIAQDIAEDWQAAVAALAWQVDLGLSEASGDVPVNRYEAPVALQPAPQRGLIAETPAAAKVPDDRPEDVPDDLAVREAARAAGAAQDLVALRGALEAFQHCELRRGARNLVFAEGRAGARVLVVAPPPGRDEDQDGKVFAALNAVLFTRMFTAIGLSPDATDPAQALYLIPTVPWRPPSDRLPDPQETAMLRPFVERHIALARPDVIVAMGASACGMLLGAASVSRVRGKWAERLGLPVLPMFDPAHLMRNTAAKREAWEDLLALKVRLRGAP